MGPLLGATALTVAVAIIWTSPAPTALAQATRSAEPSVEDLRQFAAQELENELRRLREKDESAGSDDGQSDAHRLDLLLTRLDVPPSRGKSAAGATTASLSEQATAGLTEAQLGQLVSRLLGEQARSRQDSRTRPPARSTSLARGRAPDSGGSRPDAPASPADAARASGQPPAAAAAPPAIASAPPPGVASGGAPFIPGIAPAPASAAPPPLAAVPVVLAPPAPAAPPSGTPGSGTPPVGPPLPVPDTL